MQNIISDVLQWHDFLIKDICDIIGSYIVPINEDLVKWMFAASSEPEIIVSCPSDIDAHMDDTLTIKYTNDESLISWTNLSIRDRFISLHARSFTVVLKVPHMPDRSTTYKLNALLTHMIAEISGSHPNLMFDRSMVPSWNHIFSSSSSTIGQILREKWNPESWWTHAGMQLRKVHKSRTLLTPMYDDAYFAQMQRMVAKIASR